MKVLYTFGETVDASTVMQEGVFHNDNGIMYIEGKNGNKIQLTNLKDVEIYEQKYFFSYFIKAKTRKETIIIASYRFHIKICGGIGWLNHNGTKEIRNLLEANII